MLPRDSQEASRTPVGILWESLAASSWFQRMSKRHIKRPKEMLIGLHGIAKACPRRPKTSPKVPKRSPSGPQGSTRGPRNPQEVPKGPQGVPQRSPRGPQGVPKGSSRATGRLRSRWNDGVAPKSAALRTSCERRAKSGEP